MDDTDEILCIYYLFSLICNLRTEYKRMRSVLYDQCWVVARPLKCFTAFERSQRSFFIDYPKLRAGTAHKQIRIVRA